MPKRYNPITISKLKQARLEGKSASQALKDAGYSKTTANHEVGRLTALKHVDNEILNEFKLSDLTPESVLKELNESMRQAELKGDIATKTRCIELKGKYLKMWTVKVEQNNINPKEIVVVRQIITTPKIVP